MREKIDSDAPVTSAVLPRDKAKKLGAMALFSEKYGDEVRVVCIGTDSTEKLCDAFSREFCGGTHVDRLGTIGSFKIIKEESIAAGVRRITALTANAVNEHLEKAGDLVDRLSALLKTSPDGILSRVEQILSENKKLSRELKSASKSKDSGTMDEAAKLLDDAERIGQSAIVIGQISKTTVEQARAAVDMIKKKAKSAAVVLAFTDQGRVMLLAGVTDDLIARKLSAGEIIKQIAPIVDGAGGGRPHLAEAGGKNPEKINDAIAQASQIIKAKLK